MLVKNKGACMSNEKAVKGVDIFTDTNPVVVCCKRYVNVARTFTTLGDN